jgi:hypothetical protein
MNVPAATSDPKRQRAHHQQESVMQIKAAPVTDLFSSGPTVGERLGGFISGGAEAVTGVINALAAYRGAGGGSDPEPTSAPQLPPEPAPTIDQNNGHKGFPMMGLSTNTALILGAGLAAFLVLK